MIFRSSPAAHPPFPLGGVMLRSLGLLGLLLLAAAPLGAQDPAPALPDEVAEAVVDFLNDPRRVRYEGATRIGADSVVRADIAVLDGPLLLAGRVEGSVLVANGDAELVPGASIAGDLLVVGGEVRGVESAAVRGELLAYPGRLSYRREGGRFVRVRPASLPRAREEAEEWGHSDFLIATGRSYNRVEGLPITFGPRIETAGSNPLRVHALAIYRTEAGFTLDTERMGYYVRAEQLLGGREEARVGLTAHSLVDPIEEWHLSDLENGLSTFLFHRDFRDHYERTGVSAFAEWGPAGGPLGVEAELRWERHRSQAPGSPWTLFDNAEPWRPQPLIAEGEVTSLVLQGSYDSRSRAPDPATGWLLRARVEQGLDVDLARPEAFPQDRDEPVSMMLPFPERPYGRFSTGLLDVRRYNRVDPSSRLNFRLLVGGALDGSPLPAQRQHALGGEGTLPGYELFELDCGARSGVVVHRSPAEAGAPATEAGPAFFPAYGCDAVALLQAEFRGKLSFSLRWEDAPWKDREEAGEGFVLGWDVSPDWSVFVDAGRGWALDGRPDEDLAVNVGVGLLVDRIGVYLAKPLTRGGGINAFLRLGPRF